MLDRSLSLLMTCGQEFVSLLVNNVVYFSCTLFLLNSFDIFAAWFVFFKNTKGDANLHMALGMSLQSWDIQEHTGGTYQPEALRAYHTAIKLGNVRGEDQVTLHLNCGVC